MNPNASFVGIDKIDNSVSVESAFNILRDATILYMADQEQMTAFLVLLEGGQKEIFVKLLNESKTGVGEFYAMLGLYECDKVQYNNILHSIELSKNVTLMTFRGVDYIDSATLDELRIAIENGRWMKEVRARTRSVNLFKNR
jgi:hypothetical protein